MHQSIIKVISTWISGLALVLLSSPAFAQTSQPYEMTVNGVKVIVQPSGNEIVEIRTIIKGGVQNYTADKAGIESLAMTALTECGTEKESKNSFKDQLDRVSAVVQGSAGMDYAYLRLNCIKSDLDAVWPLYIDALTIPAFDSTEFKRIKQNAINQLRSAASQPDHAIDKLAKETAFAGKDYAKDPNGTEETVSRITPEAAHAYYRSILTRSRLVIVVVADINRSELEKKISELTTAIPQGQPFKPVRYSYSPRKNSLRTEKKDLATNYIEGITAAPQPGSKDFNAYILATRIFYDRHFLEVRTNNGLSYAPIIRLADGLTPYTSIQVSTTDPDKYKAVLDQVIGKIKKEGFTPEEVKNGKTVYLTSFYYKMETNSAQAASLASNEIQFNNWRRALTFNEDLKKVTLSDVNQAFDKYVNHITWVYQGDTAKVNPALYMNEATKSKLPDSKLKTGNKD
ncbi:MAG TPA: pitrilysin family protein [Puia sp.]|nr:pitrilysin family protein [Puia sp.]